MKLTPHEEKILELVRKYPQIVDDHTERTRVAEEHGYTEKTLRNRIGDLKKYGVVDGNIIMKNYDNVVTETTTDENPEINLFDYFSILWRKKWLLISIVSFVGILSICITLILPIWFKATAVILPPSSISSPFGSIGALSEMGFGNLFGSNDSNNKYLAILKSRQLRGRLIEKYDLKIKFKKETYQETYDVLDKNIIIDIGDEMQIRVSVLDKDQEIVADMANYIIFCLDSINIELTTATARQNRIFIASRVEDIVDSLYLLEDELVNYMESEGVLSLDDQVRVGVEKIAEIQSSILLKEVELEASQLVFQNEDIKILLLKKEIESLQNKFNDMFKGNLSEKIIPSMDSIPKLKLEFEQIMRKIEYYTKLLSFLGPQYEQAKIEEVKDIPTVQILDYAIRPEKKFKPNRTMIVILSTFLGGVLTAAGIIIFESNKNKYIPNDSKTIYTY